MFKLSQGPRLAFVARSAAAPIDAKLLTFQKFASFIKKRPAA